MDYHMHALILARLVDFGQLTFVAEESDITIAQLLEQFIPGRHWAADVVQNCFDCAKCGDRLSLCVNTYRGGGGLTRKPASGG